MYTFIVLASVISKCFHISLIRPYHIWVFIMLSVVLNAHLSFELHAIL